MKKVEEFMGKHKLLQLVLIVLPLVLGGIGYLQKGDSFLDAFYGSFCLYFANPISDDYNVLIEIARWTAPIAMVVGISAVLKSSLEDFEAWTVALNPDSNAVYGSSREAETIYEQMRHAVKGKDKPSVWASNHILAFDTDVETFSFYQKYRDFWKKKPVYICLRSTDAALLKEENDALHFFDINAAISRTFWKEYAVWKREEQLEHKIAIIGFDELGQSMLERALQLNLYSLSQQLTYYVFGEHRQYQALHKDLQLMNGDKIKYKKLEHREDWELLQEMSLIIMTEDVDIQKIQYVLDASTCDVYYYSPEDEQLSSWINVKRLHPYGSCKDILTEENIKSDALYRHAKTLNASYSKKTTQSEREKEKAWQALNGFLKESNISAADYGEVLQSMHKISMCTTEEKEKLAELEHIRWCRFHFLHGWKYGKLPDGYRKDEEQKVHTYLIDFGTLPEDVKQLDRNAIAVYKDFSGE